ncbi:MAG TPA: OsmC family peroxiredoxin [Streptosporangiaceae bacterium]
MAFRVVRTAQASWQGALPDGSGRIAVGSGAFDGPYSLRARVEDGARATNPEELLGAAEACCYTMSLANLLSEAGHPARELRTTAEVTLAFADLAGQAKNCTISRALAGTEITLEASLETGS